MCEYCKKSDTEILKNIIENNVTSEAYSGCAWRRVCQVRARNKHKVTKRRWNEICSDRGNWFSL